MSTSFAEEVRAESLQGPGPRCGIAKAVAEMDEDTAAELVAALEDRDVKSVAISRVLRRRGYGVGDQAVARHRRGLCRCG